MPHLVAGAPGATSATAPAVDTLVSAVIAAQRPDGGWGAEDARPSNTEATAFCVVALTPFAEGGSASTGAPAIQASVERGVRWLTARQRADGSWPATDQVPAPSWMSSVAVLGLALTQQALPAARRGAEWLLREEGIRFDWRTRLMLWFQRVRSGDTAVELDAQLEGWPWATDTFSWVEPTSLAMLALRALARDPVAGAAPRREYRIQQGAKLLADRMVPSGGWNYGNSRVLDEDLEPYPDTTAWALLALSGTGRQAIIEPSFAALGRLMSDTSSPLARALAILALRAYGRDAAQLTGALAVQCAGPRPPNDTRTRALAVLALSSSTFPFTTAIHA